MLPPFTEAGLLPPGQHRATWEEFSARFGGSKRRQRLLRGLRLVCTNLRSAGAVNVWIDGSFVTDKSNPADFDGVWDPTFVDLAKVDPILIDRHDLRNGRLRQKAKYDGELLPFEGNDMPLQHFFQQTRDDEIKGIVLLDLRTLS